jgi:hypothetical protein
MCGEIEPLPRAAVIDEVIALIDEAERTGVWPAGIRGDALRTICYVNAGNRTLDAEERGAWVRAEERIHQHFHGDRART